MTQQMAQLTVLAHARSQLQGGTPDDHLARFQKYLGTEYACPEGHPEISMAIKKAMRDNLGITGAYRCPACFQTPVEFFD